MSKPNPYESPGYAPNDQENEVALRVDEAEQGESWGLLHWILLLIAWAFAFWNWQSFVFTSVESRRPIVFLINLLMQLPIALGMAAVLLAPIRKWQRRGTFPVHFGHWLLLIGGTNTLTYYFNNWLAIQAMRAALHGDDGRVRIGDPLDALPVAQFIVQLAALIVPCLAIAYSRGDRNWQRFGIFWICFQLSQLGLRYSSLQYYWPLLIVISAFSALLMAITFSIALLADFRRKRDPLHWIGVIWSLLCLVLLYVGSRVLALWGAY